MIWVTSFFFYTTAIGDGFLPQPESGIIPRAARLKDILDVCDREVCRHLSTAYSRVHACISTRTIPIEKPVINHGTVYNVADPTIIRSCTKHRWNLDLHARELFILIAETQISDLMDRLTFDIRLDYVRMSVGSAISDNAN